MARTAQYGAARAPFRESASVGIARAAQKARPDLDLKLRASEIARRRTEEERAEAQLSLRATTTAAIQSAMREQLERKESNE